MTTHHSTGPAPVQQMTLEDEGERLKQAGMAQALAAVTTWRAQADAWLAQRRDPFTSEDLTDAIGLPQGSIGTNRNNAVGAVISAWRTAGLIRKLHYTTSNRRNSHGAVIAVWERM